MHAMQPDKRKYSLKIGKEEVKLAIFADMIEHLETLR